MQKIEIAEKLKKIHEDKFMEIRYWGDIFYKNYPNKEKILVLLDYWLFSVRVFIDCYGLEELQELSKSNSKCLFRYSWKTEHNIDVTALDIKKYKFNLLYKSLLYLTNNILLAGSDIRNIKKKILSRLSTLIFYFSPIENNEKRKRAIMQIIFEYFEDIDDLRSCAWFVEIVPDVFYSNIVEIWNDKIKVESAPSEFIEFKGYERIFLSNKLVYLLGKQHGGGYGAYRTEYLTEYSKKLSDKYIGWGLSEFNNRQHKYYDKNELEMNHKDEKRIIWVERGRPPIIYSYLWHEYETSPIDFIANELSRAKINYFNIPYNQPYGPSKLYKNIRNTVLDMEHKRSEGIINKNDIVIFDTFGATMMHYCIEYGILFLLVTSQNSIDRFTPKQMEWFKVLHENGLGFIDDEIGSLESNITQFTDDSYNLPIEVDLYHQKHFINI
jgi:hypothetical protein